MNTRRFGRKTLQLAAQIRRTLDLVLADSDADPVLAELRIDAVEPAGGPGRFVVVVAGSADPGEVLAALARATPRLREEVADSVHRRHPPGLAFRYVPDPDHGS